MLLVTATPMESFLAQQFSVEWTFGPATKDLMRRVPADPFEPVSHTCLEIKWNLTHI
jgi:hypothetical protein